MVRVFDPKNPKKGPMRIILTCVHNNRRSEGFPNGIFHPCTLWDGVWPDGKIVAPPPSASSGNHLEKVTLTVLVFGPEWVSYERSRRVRHAKMREISARAFFVKISKSQDSMIYTMFRFFRILILKMDSFANVSVTRPGRPPARTCLLYTSPSPRDRQKSRMPSSA